MSDVFTDLDRELSGAEVLDEVRATLTRYVVFAGPEAADAVTLYAAATYAAASANFAPRLIVKSPVKRCGKTRLIVDVLGHLVHAPMTAVSMSPAALVHSIDPDSPPTIILDETDTVFTKGAKSDDRNELLRGILNSGFTRGVPYVRWDAQTRSRDECPTFAMAVLGGIDNGKMPDTIEDRAVIVTLRRKAPGEEAARFRTRRDGPKVKAVADRLSGWVTPRAVELGKAEPELPDALNDRAQDVWEPLLAVADLAGGDWPERGRRAALALSGDAEDEAAESMRLLSDLRDVFDGADALHTAEILGALCKIEEAPWGNWFGKPLDARGLARLLKPYDVRPTTVTIAGRTLKGYHRESLHDAWRRYLGPVSGTRTVGSVGSVEPQVNPPTDANPPTLGPVNDNPPTFARNVPVGGLTCDSTDPTAPTDVPPEPGQVAGDLDEPAMPFVTQSNGYGDTNGWSALSEPVTVEEVW